MFDDGIFVGRIIAAKQILLMLQGSSDLQSLAVEIKEKFGICKGEER
jgi:hypothetical protein